MTNPLAIAAVSGAVGVLVASIISMISMHLERKARKKELLVNKSIDVAFQWAELLRLLCADRHEKLEIVDPIVNTETYHRWLSQLWKDGTLPKDAIEQLEKYKKYMNKSD